MKKASVLMASLFLLVLFTIQACSRGSGPVSPARYYQSPTPTRTPGLLTPGAKTPTPTRTPTSIISILTHTPTPTSTTILQVLTVTPTPTPTLMEVPTATPTVTATPVLVVPTVTLTVPI